MQEIYIFKQGMLYGKLQNNDCYILENNDFIPSKAIFYEIIDVLPEGIDLKIMLKAFNCKTPIQLLPYLRNCIGDFSFSSNIDDNNFQKFINSNINLEQKFPNILNAFLNINQQNLNPESLIYKPNQRLSLSGYQHKLQVSIIDNVIEENYADFILKPANDDFYNLAINEHLNVNFMSEFGFEVPLNAIVYDEILGQYHYLIKRFDRDEMFLPQISLNALMHSKDKYEGSIEKICSFLKDKLSNAQKKLFLQYIYANALLFNNDLHKKNISFVFDNGELKLSPAYDVINIYVLKKLDKTQCVLHINGKLNRIQIGDFRQSSQILGFDFNALKDSLNETLETYLNVYPKYIEKLSEIPHLCGLKKLQNTFLQSYDKNLKLARKQNIQPKIQNFTSNSLEDRMQILESNQQSIQNMQSSKDLTQEKNLTQDSKIEKNAESKRDSAQSADSLKKLNQKRKHK
ncbi:type II toxin-antitoxin system HipA family toxin [Helicobacter turcicus]|uniref:HipA domain-containing protein n=1 Tax=Helicobacter turcicus TaxID=2867412 RepID=A0ABS7JPC8_9HELI|nr:HipA domain-containing protein [Helicobacter turcicus]MBX7491257.1 HipA domain-containing protein [Helicobacter turcicus]MBX7546104.1 HipA domain-containing protein [Helicobacter turcicus]